MIWSEVITRYGKDMADRMEKSPMLKGITITIRDDGKWDIPEEDILRAYRDILGETIHPHEID